MLIVDQPIGNVFKGMWALTKRYPLQIFRGNVVGTLVGALPGAGADIAAWMSYAISKKFSKEPEKFGTGHVEGIVESGSANNSALAGAWIPALVFGIPGDSITAIVIGVLYMKNMNPGPTLFTQNPQNIYAVYLLFIVANILMIPLGWLCIKAAKQILRVPRNVLMPLILLFCIVGTFAINNTVFDVGVMLIAGVVAYVLEENGFPERAGDPRRGAGRDARGELHHLDDQVRRQPARLFQPPDRRDARRADAVRVVPATASSGGCGGWRARSRTLSHWGASDSRTLRRIDPLCCDAVKSSGFDRHSWRRRRTRAAKLESASFDALGALPARRAERSNMRRKLVAGNWKMNGGLASNARLLDRLACEWTARRTADARRMRAVPIPRAGAGRIDGNSGRWGAQRRERARGGRVHRVKWRQACWRSSVAGMRSSGIRSGGSCMAKRDAIVGAKARAALAAGLTPIACVGETLAEREHGATAAVVARQLAAVIDALGDNVARCGRRLRAGLGDRHRSNGRAGRRRRRCMRRCGRGSRRWARRT